MDSTPGAYPSRTYETPYGVLGPAETMALLAEAQNHRCCYCGIVMVNPYHFRPDDRYRLTIEHFVSRSRGGTDTWDNLVVACRPCNAWRSADILHDGLEISAIAWFYKRQSGADCRPARWRRREARGLPAIPARKKPKIIPSIPQPPMPGVDNYFALVYQQNVKREAKVQRRGKPFAKAKAAAKRRARAQEAFCGHDVAFGTFGGQRMPKTSTPAVPVDGASLGSLWPPKQA